MNLYRETRLYIRTSMEHARDSHNQDPPYMSPLRDAVDRFVARNGRRTMKSTFERIRKIMNRADGVHTYVACDKCHIPVGKRFATAWRGMPTGSNGYCSTCREDHMYYDDNRCDYMRSQDAVMFYRNMNAYENRDGLYAYRPDVERFYVEAIDKYVQGYRTGPANAFLTGYHGTSRNQRFLSDDWSRHMAKMDTSVPPAVAVRDVGLGVEIEGYAKRGQGAQSFIDKVAAAPGFADMIRGFEQDSSLSEAPDDAFEMITQAASLPRLREYFITQFPRNTGARSHQTTTCGLHVHVTRNIMSTAHQLRLVRFMASPAMQDFLTKVARRPASS